jgi:hypothetical protein
MHREPKAKRQIAHESLVGIGFGTTQAMIDMQNRGCQASLMESVQQKHGIRTA